MNEEDQPRLLRAAMDDLRTRIGSASPEERRNLMEGPGTGQWRPPDSDRFHGGDGNVLLAAQSGERRLAAALTASEQLLCGSRQTVPVTGALSARFLERSAPPRNRSTCR